MKVPASDGRKKARTAAQAVRTATDASGLLLAWYGRHARVLPWRARAGEAADPYRVWLSEVMLQQTTVKTVGAYYAKFLALWPDVAALAAAPLEEVLKAWAGLGYYARARNLHACAKAVVTRHGGRFPKSEADLRALPGIGSYTAAAVAAIAFDIPATPVDGNIERVVARLFAVAEPLPAAKPHIRELAASLTPARRGGDFAQAMMDLGATICTPKRPACALCPLAGICLARARGETESYPVKVIRPRGRLRRGAAFVAERSDGAVLLRNREPNGLLGGMAEVPTTDWTPEFDPRTGLAEAPGLPGIAWHRKLGTVNHVFTHFPLELVVYHGRVAAGTRAPSGMRWVEGPDLAREALPSVMRKVLAHALNDEAGRGARRPPDRRFI